MPQLIAHGKVVRPGLGVGLVRQAVARRLGVGNGVLVLEVAPDRAAPPRPACSPRAATATGAWCWATSSSSIDGRAIDSDDDLATALEAYKVGDRVKVTVVRDGREQDVTVVLKALS